MFTDTHAHLDFSDFSTDLPAVLERATASGVSRIITISTSLDGSARAVALAEAHPQIRAAVGVHPCYVDESPEEFIPSMRALALNPVVVAIGETGLDYHRNQTPPADASALHLWRLNRKRQALFFEQQLQLAQELKLNVVVHQRDSWDDTLAILRPYSGKLKAVFHCFGGSLDQAKALLDMGFYVSFTGIVTFKNAATVQETAAKLPAGTFFLETDCPFLAPVPHRGKRCEPAHTRNTAEFIAALRGESLETFASHTNASVDAFFRRG